MNISKFTQKSQEVVQGCEKIAMDYGHQEMGEEHLLASMMEVDDSLISKLIEKMGIEPEVFLAQIDGLLNKRPKVTGGDMRIDRYLNETLIYAEDEAKRMGDEYVSVEHLFLSLLAHPSREVKALFKQCQITKERFLQVLSQVRGNQRVTSDNPEATYDTLEKYGTDLVERAKEGKMDPVIGRDSEIRNVIRILSRKNKNNPVLIGEPGVGKTAAVEGLAQAVELSQAKEFVDKLPDGTQHHVAQMGRNMSGGQKQRLSIARALARKPEILVFDDSFSALDYRTDAKLREGLSKQLHDTTKIIVAQRISTIRHADKIVVLDRGEAVGIGTHEELMRNCDVYREIATSQLSAAELA